MAAVARDVCGQLIADLPLASVKYAFAYGSGAIPQKGENPAEKMVDLVLCTNDSLAFHTENLQRNRSHYSAIKWAGPRTVAKLQNCAARVTYNTHIRTIGGRLIKYGVIEEGALKRDLLDWKWLYIAGRLHKPVIDVIDPSPAMAECVTQNRLSAMQAALLLLPDQFTFPEFFERLVALSYMGDFRMIIGEDKEKVAKIAKGNAEGLRAIYEPLLQADLRVEVQEKGIIQDASTTAIYHRLNLLPMEVLNRLLKRYNKGKRQLHDVEEMLFVLAGRHDVNEYVEDTMASIVRDSSITQTMKNAATAGVYRSIVYSAAKLVKWKKSLKTEEKSINKDDKSKEESNKEEDKKDQR